MLKKLPTWLVGALTVFDVHSFLTLFWRQRLRYWIGFLLAYSCFVLLREGIEMGWISQVGFLFCPWLSNLSALISIYREWLYWDATVCFDTGCVLWLAVFFLLLTNLYWSFIQLHSVSAWKSYWCFREIWVVLLCVLIAPFSYPLIECNDWVTYISPSKFHLL